MATAMPVLNLQKLNDRFAIPGIAQVVAGNGGLPKVRVTTASASGEVYLHGAHLTSWVPAGGEEVIFLSDKATFQEGKAIRGGVPICFPWFNAKSNAKDYDPPAPSHGFIRTKTWELESVIHEGNAVSVTLATQNEESTRKWWPQDFRAEMRITIGARLKMELIVTNTSDALLTFQEALHTYYRVGQIQPVRLVGLDGVTYLDNTDGLREKQQTGDLYFEKSTDNLYANTRAEVELIDPSLGRRLVVGKENSLNTVVWNPWHELAIGLADLGDEEWQQMLCVEAANVRAAAITLNPEEQHTMTATIRAESLD